MLSCCYANASERFSENYMWIKLGFQGFFSPLEGKAGEIKALWPASALWLWQNTDWHKYPHSLKIRLRTQKRVGADWGTGVPLSST